MAELEFEGEVETCISLQGQRKKRKEKTIKKMLDRRKAKCIQRGLFRCSIRKLRVKKKKGRKKRKKKKIGQLPDRVSEANPDN